MFEVHISKHSLFRLKITVGCPRCVGVGVWWWCCVLCGCCVLVLCGVEWCGVVWGGVGCVCVFFVLFFSYFSQFSSFSYLLSLFPSLFFPSSLFFSSLLFSLPRFLFSSLHVTIHCGKNRSHNTAANFEACECDLAHGSSGFSPLLLSTPSSLLSSSSSKK